MKFMKVVKKNPVDLLEQKIMEFEFILSQVSERTLYDEAYKFAFTSTEEILEEVFGKKEALRFREYTTNLSAHAVAGPIIEAEITLFKDHIKRCIKKLEIFKENFYSASFNEFTEFFKDPSKLFYISSSIEKKHQEISEHIMEILRALQFNFNKGAVFNDSKDLESIKDSINESEFFLCVIGKKSGSLSSEYSISSRLETEIELAKQSRKTIIAWVEKGTSGIGEIFDSAEVIQFQIENLESLKSTTISFLEILKKYRVI